MRWLGKYYALITMLRLRLGRAETSSSFVSIPWHLAFYQPRTRSLINMILMAHFILNMIQILLSANLFLIIGEISYMEYVHFLLWKISFLCITRIVEPTIVQKEIESRSTKMNTAFHSVLLIYAVFTTVSFSSPLSDINGCVTTWDSWGIACGGPKTCENAPYVILGE